MECGEPAHYQRCRDSAEILGELGKAQGAFGGELEWFDFEMKHARLSYVCACRSVHLLAQAHFSNSAD